MIHIDPILSLLSNLGIADISTSNVMKILLIAVLHLGVSGFIFGKTSLGFLILSKLFKKTSLTNFL